MSYNNENSGESSGDGCKIYLNINYKSKNCRVTDKQENTSDNEGVEENTAWADSVAKILKSSKPKKKRTLILSRAKKINETPKTDKTICFEVQGEDGKIKQLENEVKGETNNAVQRTIKKKKLPKLCVKPNMVKKEERMLSRIATKGIVQLFNAIQTQQKIIDTQLKDAGPLEVKKDKALKKVDKRLFLDMLMGSTNAKVDKTADEKVNMEENCSSWNVLRDDFMMKAKMKDWDKELEQNIEMECEEHI